jgi:hypothetical protein
MRRTNHMNLTDAARDLGIDPKTLLSWFESHGVEYLKVEAGASRRPRYLVNIEKFEEFKKSITVRPEKKGPGRPSNITI